MADRMTKPAGTGTVQQRQTWGRKNPGFGGRAASECHRARALARERPPPLIIPTLIDLRVIDLMSSPFWWEAAALCKKSDNALEDYSM